MLSRKWLVFVSILLFITVLPYRASANAAPSETAFLSEYVQTIYDEDSIIPVSQVKSALQTGDGYMWFGGYQGLMRYDGMDTVLFTPGDGFPTYSVNVLYEDRQGQLWIGTNDNGIVLYHQNKFKVYSIEEGLPSASVRGIAGDERGNIAVSTTSGIAFIAPNGALTVHPMLNNVFSTGIAYIGGGQFICLLNDGEIMRFNETDRIQTYGTDDFRGEQPHCLFVSEEEEIYIGTTGNTVFTTDPGMSQYNAFILPDIQSMNRFYEDSSGRIWVCADNGIGYIIAEEFTWVDGLQMNNSIECMTEDYEGNLWIGSSRQGLIQLTRSRFQNISFVADLPETTVNTTAVFQDDLYIGTDQGLIILREHVPIQTQLTEMLNGIRIRCMMTDSKGQLWICTYEDYGVVLVKENGAIRYLAEENGLVNNKTRCIIESANGDILVGLSGGINVIRGEKVVKSYTSREGLTNDVILCLTEGADGVLYAGSDGGGIYAIEGDTVRNYTEKDGLAAGIILRMAMIDGRLWISTGNAICVMDETGIRTIDKLAAHDDNVFDIKQIGEEIWFLHSRGVSICMVKNLLSDEALQMRQFLKRDGLSAPITANSWNALTVDGFLYLSTGKGVLRIGTEDSGDNSIVPFAVISEVLADGVPVDRIGDVNIAAHTGRLDIYIALLSFASKDGTVSYMLEGFDSEPKTVPRSALSRISYTNLKGGRYVFTVYGTNASGLQSETVTLIINKEYGLTEMPFVRVCFVLLGIGVLALSVRVFIHTRTQKVMKQQQAYKEITGQIMSVAAAMTDSRDAHSSEHSRRVAEYAKLVGKRLGMSEDELETLYYAAILHDIGKASISDSILNKKGRLTDEEFEEVKKHVTIGGDLLREITVFEGVALGAQYHHERVDGTGYAEGLSGENIPLIARIICVCNAFDSMLSDRPYRKAMSVEKAQSELIHCAGKQFDERVTAILISLIHEGSVPL